MSWPVRWRRGQQVSQSVSLRPVVLPVRWKTASAAAAVRWRLPVPAAAAAAQTPLPLGQEQVRGQAVRAALSFQPAFAVQPRLVQA